MMTYNNQQTYTKKQNFKNPNFTKFCVDNRVLTYVN